jgi:hypothetical protein
MVTCSTVNLYQTTLRHIREKNILCCQRRENLKSCRVFFFVLDEKAPAQLSSDALPALRFTPSVGQVEQSMKVATQIMAVVIITF